MNPDHCNRRGDVSRYLRWSLAAAMQIVLQAPVGHAECFCEDFNDPDGSMHCRAFFTVCGPPPKCPLKTTHDIPCKGQGPCSSRTREWFEFYQCTPGPTCSGAARREEKKCAPGERVTVTEDTCEQQMTKEECEKATCTITTEFPWNEYYNPDDYRNKKTPCVWIEL